jgi:long-chain acyl-CoA synthetase
MGQPISAPASVLAAGEQEGPFALRRHPLCRDGAVKNPPEWPTMQQAMLSFFSAYADREMLGARPLLPNGAYGPRFTFLKYSDCFAVARDFGAGLAALGVGVGSPFGVCAQVCCEWVHAITASCLYGFTIAPLHEGLGQHSLAFEVGHSRMAALLVSQKALPRILEILRADRGGVNSLILTAPACDADLAAQAECLGVRFATFAEICRRGREAPLPFPKFGPESALLYGYSSGATGAPKGVVVSHRAMVSALLGSRTYAGRTEVVRHLAFLPYGHIFERVSTTVVLSIGGVVAVVSGSVTNLTEDIRLFRPTVLCSVPRIYRRFYDGINANLRRANPLVRWLFWSCYYAKRFCQEQGWAPGLFDALAFRSVQAAFGGAFTELVSGGAALDPPLHEFFQIIFGVPMRNGYGLTESVGGVVCSPDSTFLSRPGLTGGPVVTAEVKIDPIPDYDDPDCGEILLGGEGLCSGYLYDDAATKALFVDETRRMIRTGDIGKYDHGYLRIVDRCRSIFKLSQGEYVAAEMVTQAYEDSKFISQLFVYGDSTKTYLVGVVVPKMEAVAEFAGRAQISDAEYEELCRSEKLRRVIMEEMTAIASAKGLLDFQCVKAIHVDSRAWTPDNDLLTPTFKIRRRALAEHYREAIEDLYRRPVEGDRRD